MTVSPIFGLHGQRWRSILLCYRYLSDKDMLLKLKKKNGTCSVIFVDPDKNVTAMNRHNEVHRAWSPEPEVWDMFRKLPGRGWYVFVAELLHNKVRGIRNINYVHDVLVANGDYLVGITQEDRQDRLHDLLLTGDVKELPHYYELSANLWVPVEYEGDFANLFNSLHKDEEEGVVLKNPKQKLVFCSRQLANTAGQIKARRYHKNYAF